MHLKKFPSLKLQTERLNLKTPRWNFGAQWCRLRQRNRVHLRAWEPLWENADFSADTWRQHYRFCRKGMRMGTLLPIFLFLRDSSVFLGGVTLGQIRRGAGQSAVLGYWLGEEFTRKGFMHEALTKILRWAFHNAGLHRIEAYCMAENMRSRRVLEKLYFQNEGIVRHYLQINGVWRDHLLYGLLANEYSCGGNPSLASAEPAFGEVFYEDNAQREFLRQFSLKTIPERGTRR